MSARSDPRLVERLNRCLDSFGASLITDLNSVYSLYPDERHAFLGEGSYGKAYTVRSVHCPTDPVRVCKVIPKERVTRRELQIQHICAELAVALKMAPQSPRLNSAIGLYHNEAYMFIVLEMTQGPTPDLATRLYHLFARYHPARIPEVEGIIAKFDGEWDAIKAKLVEDYQKINPDDKQGLSYVTANKYNQLCDREVKMVLDQLGVKKEQPVKTDLFNLICAHKKVPEAKAAVIIKQCLQGIDFMHSNQVVHRDIKTENVIVGESRSAEPIKDESGKVIGVTIKEKIDAQLIDYGLVKHLRVASVPLTPTPGDFEHDPFADADAPDAADGGAANQQDFQVTVTPCGTELYSSLEVLKGILDAAGQGKWISSAASLPKLDVYGCGTMLFCMCNGRAPFRLPKNPYRPLSQAEKLRQIGALIAAGPQFSSSVSPRSKQFTDFLMRNDPKARPSAAAALMDSYFQGVSNTYAYRVNCDGQVEDVTLELGEGETAEDALKEDALMEAMRGQEDAGDSEGKVKPESAEASGSEEKKE